MHERNINFGWKPLLTIVAPLLIWELLWLNLWCLVSLTLHQLKWILSDRASKKIIKFWYCNHCACNY